MLYLEQAVKNIVTGNGIFVIPLSAFSFNWDVLNTMFISTLKKFEKWKPVNKRIYTTVSPSGIVLPDAIEVKNVAMMSGNMIPAQASPFQSDDFYFDPVTKLLQSVGTSQFLVTYLGSYTLQTNDFTQQFTCYTGEKCITEYLTVVPNISTLNITYNDETMTITSKDHDYIEFSSPSAQASLCVDSLKFELQRTQFDGEANVTISYTSAYKAIKELNESDEFFETWFGSVLLSSLGSIKAITKFESLPVDVTTDDMLTYGRQLKETVNTYQIERSNWYDMIGM